MVESFKFLELTIITKQRIDGIDILGLTYTVARIHTHVNIPAAAYALDPTSTQLNSKIIIDKSGNGQKWKEQKKTRKQKFHNEEEEKNKMIIRA